MSKNQQSENTTNGMSKEPTEFTRREAREVVQQWGEMGKRFEEVKREVMGTGRWTVSYRGVYRDTETSKLWVFHWSEGSTEQQSEQPFEYTDPDPVEVKPTEVTVTKYVPVEQ
jgi:hypothetical protein